MSGITIGGKNLFNQGDILLLTHHHKKNVHHNAHKLRMFGLYQLRYRYRHYLSEFFGCVVMTFLGVSSASTFSFYEQLMSEYWLINALSWGAAVTMAMYVSFGSSGGHLNPAVTISMAVFGRFKWKRVPGYIVSQILGCIVGSALSFSIYVKKYNAFDGGVRKTTGPKATASIFASYPDADNSNINGFYQEFLATCALLFVLQGISDKKMYPAKNLQPIVVGMLVFVISATTGILGSSNLNPARDLGPRIFTAIAGWGSEPFTVANHYFWIPIVAPILGAIVGTGLYELFVIPNNNE
ncbi:Aquaporin-9 [Smittium culicis]|uniref:Aquaporin-9 n=1 Tax=Smittium culicis TaxID=133412 RepID=A0A1R1XR77_9FUNG|nr:Aquaporin-9 [Smittium culicis]